MADSHLYKWWEIWAHFGMPYFGFPYGNKYKMDVEGSNQCDGEELFGLSTAPSFCEGRAHARSTARVQVYVSTLVLEPVFQMKTPELRRVRGLSRAPGW